MIGDNPLQSLRGNYRSFPVHPKEALQLTKWTPARHTSLYVIAHETT